MISETKRPVPHSDVKTSLELPLFSKQLWNLSILTIRQVSDHWKSHLVSFLDIYVSYY